MRSLISLSFLLLLSSFSMGQIYSTAPVAIKVQTESRYVIGIGNQELTMYNNILDNLQSNTAIKVYAICETHRVIGISVQNSEYKSYDKIKDLLLSQYPTVLLFKKDDTILNLDCKNEISKQ